VSILTGDNPHTPVPYGGSTLDGVEFARHVMNMPVRFVDVQPDAQVGKIALSTMVTVNDAQRLRSGRLYGWFVSSIILGSDRDWFLRSDFSGQS
jgi:hypothetical protein